MKQKFKKNQVIEVYADYRNTDKSYGKVKLIEYLRPGETFITGEKDESGEQIIWFYERWVVEFIESKYYKKGHKKQHNIRFNFRDVEPNKKIINYPPVTEFKRTFPDEDRPFDYTED